MKERASTDFATKCGILEFWRSHVRSIGPRLASLGITRDDVVTSVGRASAEYVLLCLLGLKYMQKAFILNMTLCMHVVGQLTTLCSQSTLPDISEALICIVKSLKPIFHYSYTPVQLVSILVCSSLVPHFLHIHSHSQFLFCHRF